MKTAKILYGTVTGNAHSCANQLCARLKDCGVPVHVLNISEFSPADLSAVELLLVVTSTTGSGDPPYDAMEMFQHLHDARPDLSALRFGVLALGSTHFANFAQCGKDFDAILEELGAQRVVDRVDCDGPFEGPLDTFQERLFDYFAGEPERYPDFTRIAAPVAESPSAAASTSSGASAAPLRRSIASRVKGRIKRVLRKMLPL